MFYLWGLTLSRRCWGSSSSCMDCHREYTFIYELNCHTFFFFFLMLQKPRLPQEIVSLMWILKVTDLAIVVSLAMSTRSVPLGKWRWGYKGMWMILRPVILQLLAFSPLNTELFKLTFQVLEHKTSARLWKELVK